MPTSASSPPHTKIQDGGTSHNPWNIFADGENTLLLDSLQSVVNMSSGYGSGFHQNASNILSQFEKFGCNPAPPNTLNSGYFFITRPKLCLATPNIRNDRIMAMLDTIDPNTFSFSIRGYLDTNLYNMEPFNSLFQKCEVFNDYTPFIVPLCNVLDSISGFPDFVLDTLTTQGGYFEEDQTTGAGSDFNARSYDLSLNFLDISGTYTLALIYLWVRYIALVTRGVLTVYWEDIFNQRLCYTCSIYRFITDPTNRQIQMASKCTGCFPKAVPLGAFFDMNKREKHVAAAQGFSVPFQANTVEYLDWVILKEFNIISDRFYSSGSGITIQDSINNKTLVPVPLTSEYNYVGIPYIDLTTGSNTLTYYTTPDVLESIQAQLSFKDINAALNRMEQKIQNTKPTTMAGNLNTYA